MNPTDFVAATGYLRTAEKKILTTSGIDRIVDVHTGDEALKMLSQSSELDFAALERADDYETVLKAELKRVYDMIYAFSSEPLLVDVLSTKYDFHNIKVAVKARYINGDYEPLFIHVTRLDPDVIKKVAAGDSGADAPDYVYDAVAQASARFEETNDPQVIDLVLDKIMFVRLLDMCETLDNAFITGYVRTQIDFYNAKTLLRVKNMQKGLKFLSDAIVDGGTIDTSLFLECYNKSVEAIADSFKFNYFGGIMRDTIEGFEKTGNYSAMEKLSDNYLLGVIKETKMIAFGPELLFAYIAAKENEIKQIRILITCKANNISADVLRERLRDNYA